MNAAATAVILGLLATSTPPATDSVGAGLKWLVAQQREDGSWAGANNASPTIVTSTAGLALLMEGSTPQDGAFAPNIRKAVAWIEKNSSAEGLLASNADLERSQSAATHAQALLFLSCAYDVDDDENRRQRVAKLLDKAVAFAVACQAPRGGWGFVTLRPGNDFDESQTTAVMLQALLAARKAGIDVPKETTNKAIDYLVMLTDPRGGVVYTLARGARPRAGDGQPSFTAATATALLMHDGFRPVQLPEWVKFANANSALRFLRDGTGGAYAFVDQCHLARAMFALGENGYRRLTPGQRETDLRWSTFREPLFKALKESQRKDGAWPDLYVGPGYTTALALVMLQLDNGYIPAFSR